MAHLGISVWTLLAALNEIINALPHGLAM